MATGEGRGVGERTESSELGCDITRGETEQFQEVEGRDQTEVEGCRMYNRREVLRRKTGDQRKP